MLRHDRWLAPALGLLAACGFQPLALWPATLLGLAGLIALVAAAPGWRRAALLGWLWGLGHFTLGNNWIAAAFTFQAKMAWWLGWLAVPGLALYLAVYPALATVVGWRFRARPLAMLPAFAGAWIVSEWARGWVFTGFAWNPLGVVALGPFARPGLASLAPWLGTYGLSGLVALLGCCWWLAARPGPRGARLVLALAPVVAMLLPGAAPLAGGHDGVPYTLVQPNIAEDRLNDPANYENQFIATALLSLPRNGARRLVLWPESGVPDYLRPGYPAYIYRATTYAGDPVLARWRIGRVIGPASLLLTGTADLSVSPQGEVTAARNVVTALDGAGAIRGSYAKAHLVPYGEYLPLRGLLAPLGIDRLVPGDMDFSPGPGPRTLDLGPWGKAGVQICYEIVFSGKVVDRTHRPDFIFNPSNDGWFGSWGPPQHLAQARLRAIEEGLPVLRATVSGISAVIEADGRVRSSLPWGRAGRLDGRLPAALPPTLFARFGNVLPLGTAIGLLALAMLAMRRRRGYGVIT
ncbi:MAG: apolipoprotein N-acyltransferase [Proteobacteria bacterium]|nr:apolipoprotein N-acyltransferase [Pseudomonadota bacterium]